MEDGCRRSSEMNNTQTAQHTRTQPHVSNDACAKNYGVDIWNMYNDIFYRNNSKAIFNAHTHTIEPKGSTDESGQKMNGKRRIKSGLIGPIHGVNWSRHAYTIHASILCIYSPLSCVRYSFYLQLKSRPLTSVRQRRSSSSSSSLST